MVTATTAEIPRTHPSRKDAAPRCAPAVIMTSTITAMGIETKSRPRAIGRDRPIAASTENLQLNARSTIDSRSKSRRRRQHDLDEMRAGFRQRCGKLLGQLLRCVRPRRGHSQPLGYLDVVHVRR